jgi:hypothetical protein
LVRRVHDIAYRVYLAEAKIKGTYSVSSERIKGDGDAEWDIDCGRVSFKWSAYYRGELEASGSCSYPMEWLWDDSGLKDLESRAAEAVLEKRRKEDLDRMKYLEAEKQRLEKQIAEMQANANGVVRRF